MGFKVKAMPTVSIIIVNYNGEYYLDKLLSSLEKQTYRDFEIIIVDNASTDNSLQLIRKYSKRLPIHIIKNEKNLGFCLANNLGLKKSKGKFVVLLNNDTYVDSNCLLKLVKKAEENTKIAAVTCSILHPHSNIILEGPMLYDMYGAALSAYADDVFFYGTGACLLVKRDILRWTGAFDSELFMYQDDVDLCWRIRLQGFDIAYEPRAICYHLKKSRGIIEDNLKMPLWKFYHAHCKNRLRVLVKNYSGVNVVRRAPLTLFLIFLRSLILAFVNRNSQYLFALVRGLLWNLRNLRSTLIERFKTQKRRKLTDKEIQKYMLRYPIEVLFALNYFCTGRLND